MEFWRPLKVTGTKSFLVVAVLYFGRSGQTNVWETSV